MALHFESTPKGNHGYTNGASEQARAAATVSSGRYRRFAAATNPAPNDLARVVQLSAIHRTKKMNAIKAAHALLPYGPKDREWLVEARTALAPGGFDVDDEGCILRDGRLTSLMLAPILGGGAVYVCEVGAGCTKYWRGSPSNVFAVVHWLLSYEGP